MIKQKLKDLFPEHPELRVREIVVTKQNRKINCVVSHPDTVNLPANVRNGIFAAVKSCAPQGYYCTTILQADVFTEVSFKKYFFDTVKKHFPAYQSLSSMDVVVNKTGLRSFSVNVYMTDNLLQLAKASNFVANFVKMFTDYSCYDLKMSLLLSQKVDDINEVVKSQEKLVQLAISKEINKPIRKFVVTDVMRYIGKKVEVTPSYIVDIRQPKNLATICGKISEKSIKPAKNNPNLHICKFKLSDASATIDCILFVKYKVADAAVIKDTTGKSDEEVETIARTSRLHNEKLHKQLLELYDNTEVVLDGKVVLSNYSSKLEMQVYNLSKCRILNQSEQPVYIRDVPADYSMVQPKKVDNYQQLTFDSNTPSPSLHVVKGTYVVVNVDATGPNYLTDKILKISAVKLLDGVVCEHFETIVNPELEVDAQLKEQLNLPWDKLVYYPTLTEVVGDVYKFAYQSTLLGENVPQLLNFLNYYSMPVGYKFTNATRSIGDVLSELFEYTSKGKPNCSKLEDVAKKLGVDVPSLLDSSQKSQISSKCIEILLDLAKK